MEGKCARIEKTVPIDPHRPYVVAAAGYRVNAITVCARIRAWHHRPCAAVPMQRQGLAGGELSIRVFAGSPNVVAAAGCCIKTISICAYIRACHLRPCAPVPVQRERPTGLATRIV